MPAAVPLISAFNRGELSPLMASRVDLDVYQRAVARMDNMIPLAQGPATRRPGTEYVARAKSDTAEILIEFEFSTVQAYVIEAGPGYFRFYKDGGRIETSPGVAYEIATPYTAGLLYALQWAQSADVLYLAHPNFAPRKLTRTGDTSWTLSTISFTGAPSDWTGFNFPSCVTFWQSRLWWAGTPQKPQTLWASKTGDFENLTTGADADDALSFTLDDDQMNAIRWIKSQRILLVGTASGEFAVTGGGVGEPVTPSNVQAARQSTTGSAPVVAQTVGNSVVFVQRSARKLFEAAYSFEADGYVPGELSALGGHLLRAGVVRMAWQQEPWRVLWCVMADGTLRGVTYMKDQQVLGIHRQTIGGSGVKVLSACCIPGPAAVELWLLVERTIGGTTRRYVERLGPEFWPDEGAASPLLGAVFMDSVITYSGTPATTITGLGHLEGQVVQVLADGATHPDRTVTSGSITLMRPASLVRVGLRADAMVRSLDLAFGAADGTSQTRRRRVHEVGLVLFQSMGFEIGFYDARRDISVTDRLETRRPSSPMDQPPAMVSRQLVVKVPGDWLDNCQIEIRSEQPLPLTLVGLAPRVQTN
jgi:hypothetical protein